MSVARLRKAGCFGEEEDLRTGLTMSFRSVTVHVGLVGLGATLRGKALVVPVPMLRPLPHAPRSRASSAGSPECRPMPHGVRPRRLQIGVAIPPRQTGRIDVAP